MARQRKSQYMISTTGRRPDIAMPMAAPTMPFSEIGVSTTRVGPNSSSRPRVAPKIPPYTATSWPSTITVSSRRISWRSASFSASAYVIGIMTGAPFRPISLLLR
jgi:hypothetical protein